MDKKSIQAKIRALGDEGRAIYGSASAEKRQITADEQKRLDEIKTELDQCDEDLKRHNDQSEFEQRVAGYQKFPQATEAPAESEQKPLVEDRSKFDAWPVEHAGDFLRSIVSWRSAHALPRDIHPELRETFMAALEKRAPTGHGTTVESEGGFLVPSTISQTILRKVFSEGSIVSRCQQVPITVGDTATWNAVKENSRVSGSRYGGITVGRAAQAASVSGTKAQFERLSLQLKKLLALVYVTEEQVEDGPQLLTVVNDLVPRAIQFDIEDEIINSNGGSEMEGILNANALVTVAKETGQAAATILYENIVNMWSRMHAPSRPNAVWLINQDIEPQLLTMTLGIGTAGVPVYLPAGGASASPYGSLMGRPVIPVEHCQTLGTVGDIVLADFSQYLYASKGGVRTAQSMHVKFVEGETAFRFMLRNDGKPWWPSALTPANGSNTVSPFVALATRS